MTYIPAPDAKLDTPFGNFRLIATSESTVRLLLRFEGADDTITVNGVEYHATVDLKFYDDNPADAPFSPLRTYYNNGTGGPSDRFYVGSDACHLKRVDNYKDASEAAKRKFLKVVTEMANAFLVTEAGKALLVAGGARKVADAVARKEREISEAEAKLATLRDELAQLLTATGPVMDRR